MQQIKPLELKTLREKENLTLLDVREASEFAICHLQGSINIPLGRIALHLMEFDLDQKIVTICHHGMRSHAAADFLETKGFTQLINLQGGIDAWAREIDPDMRRY